MHLNIGKFNILYVKENYAIEENIISLLQDSVHSIFMATDSEKVLEEIEDKSINLVIIDLKFSQNDSFMLVKSIKRKYANIGLIILSGHNDVEALHLSIEHGVDGYLDKPIDTAKLLMLIEKIKKRYLKPSFVKRQQKRITTNDFLEYGEHRVIDYVDSFNETVVVLIKIEEFKYLNFSIKSKISKKLKKRFAKKLFQLMPKRCWFGKIYLLERGEFIFTRPYQVNEDSELLVNNIREFQESFNSAKIKIGLVDYTLSIMVSLAYGKNALENVKVGMRSLKMTKERFIVSNTLLEKEQDFAVKKLQTFKMIQSAIKNYNIVSYFQPIVNNRTKKVEKYESLVRLIDENNKIISPYFFLETAKEGKYYQEITSIVLRNSFRALFETDMEISINLSTLDMEEKRTRDDFYRLLERYKTESHRITVEIVEDENGQDFFTVQEFIQTIKARGVNIAIDDFGTGFSNFARVLSYEPNYIKIDGSLIKGIATDSVSRNMVETIVYFSKRQNIKTIAEYVENEPIYNVLCEIGVDYSQGYYFGKAEQLKRKAI